MSDTANFRDLLSMPAESYDRPRSLPDGHYTGTILGFEFGRTSGKQTPYCRWNIKVDEAGDDVIEDTSTYDFSRIELRADFFITPKAVFMLGDALDAVLGKQPGRTTDERLPEVEGARVTFKVTRRLNEDGTDTGFNNVDTRNMVAV